LRPVPGFQAVAASQLVGTPGEAHDAAILSGAQAVKIHGSYVPVRAEVASIDNLSAHADADEILQWLKGFGVPPRRTFITHGEAAAADALRLRIEETFGWRCEVPDYLESAILH
jgi:metallo-beta-lactamase family protein